jgi:CRISPR type I-E-associated protein CasB/Cse2
VKAEFVLFFQKLKGLGTGDRAALRRSAGEMLKEADGKAITVFYRCLPYGVPQWQEDRWFAVACLCCLWDAESDNGAPFEKIVSNLIQEERLSSSTQHKVEILLDTAWDDDGYLLTKLTRLIKMIRQKSDRVPIDFSALLEDLIYWNAENQSVQRKWARSMFTTISEE